MKHINPSILSYVIFSNCFRQFLTWYVLISKLYKRDIGPIISYYYYYFLIWVPNITLLLNKLENNYEDLPLYIGWVSVICHRQLHILTKSESIIRKSLLYFGFSPIHITKLRWRHCSLLGINVRAFLDQRTKKNCAFNTEP